MDTWGLWGLDQRTAMAGYDEYAGSHRSPGPGTGFPVWDMTGTQGNHSDIGGVPEDWYTHSHYYSSGASDGGSAKDMKATQKLYNDMRGKPDHPVTVYRALPHGNADFNTGDWVTPSLNYAKQHAMQSDNPAEDWPVIKTTVPAKHLYQNGDSYDEFGYHGPSHPGTVHGARTAAVPEGYKVHLFQSRGDGGGIAGIYPAKVRPNGSNWHSAITWDSAGKINNLDTKPEHQGKGLARGLYEHVRDNWRPDLMHDHALSEDGAAFANAVGGQMYDDEEYHQRRHQNEIDSTLPWEERNQARQDRGWAPPTEYRPQLRRSRKAMTAAVTLFTKPACPQCDMTKKQLEKHGIPHDVVDLTQDPSAYDFVTGDLGYSAAPVVHAGDDNHWSGFRPDRIKGLIG